MSLLSGIQAIHAREILDSRGNPTVETEVQLASGAWGERTIRAGEQVVLAGRTDDHRMATVHPHESEAADENSEFSASRSTIARTGSTFSTSSSSVSATPRITTVLSSCSGATGY